uniref:uncharacterized protein LOC122590006 isoform X2 n=1 Tax=Erigeron canadensis TaxID=72917 RepID=UPI001CB940FB|nr:uncharacterized protein LOC122590006 isoform X2 [Erigeron canadensis]
MMINRINFLLLFISQQAIAFNLSHFIFPKVSHEFRPPPSQFLTDVIGSISESEKWKLEDIRVSKLEIEKVRYGNMQRYEIEFLLANKKDYVFHLRDEVSMWKRFRGDNKGSDFEVLANRVSSRAVVGSVRMEGPLELIVSGDGEMSLALPWNTSHAGLKRILVGEDITVEVKNAHEVSLFQTTDLGRPEERNLIALREQCRQWFFPYLTCMALLPVRISGSASVVAFRTRNPGQHITINLLSKDIIDLSPDICYSEHTNKKQRFPVVSLRMRIRLLEKILKSFLGVRINSNAARAKLKAKIKASTTFRFHLELERNIRMNDTRWKTMAEWRTRPNVEHVWFEVCAMVE